MDFSKIRNYLFLGFLLVVTVISIYIIKPFAYPIFWAAVIAGISYPFYKRLDGFIKHPTLSAIATLFIVTFIIIIPLIIIVFLLMQESLSLYDTVTKNREQINIFAQQIADFVKSNPILSSLGINQASILQKISDVSTTLVNFTFDAFKNFTQNSLTFIIMFILMLYTLFFFLRDGEKLLKKIMFLLPLGDKYEKLLYQKFTSTARSALKGSLMVGIVQGTLGGILFASTGIPGSLIWGIIMALFSLVPGIGPSIIWLPAAIIMLILGNIWQGVTIILVGTFVIGTIDNLLRPILVGKDLQMHPLMILFSTLGGIAMFGITGFIIGPIVAALFLSFWEMYEHYYQSELANN